MKSWVKLYTEILDDPDIGSLTWAQRGLFLALLALAGKLDTRDGDDMETGRLDTLERTAWHLRCGADELSEAVGAFSERGFIDERDGMLYLTHYPDRQAHSPSEDRNAVAERVKRHRERKALARNEDVTPLQDARNERVTPLEKKREDKNTTEETRAESPAAPSASSPPRVPSPFRHDTVPENESLRLLHQAFQRGTGQAVTEALPTGAAKAALRQLLDDDRSPEDIEACARCLKAGWWSDKTLTVPKVAEAIGQWIAQDRPAKPKEGARAGPDAAHQAPAMAAFRVFQEQEEAKNGNGHHASAGDAGRSVPAGEDRGGNTGGVPRSPG